MLKKYIIIIYAAVIIVFLSFNGLYALGVGGYVAANGGISGLRTGDASSNVQYGLQGGFVLDTAVGLNQLFNYRLGVGYENAMKSGNSFFDQFSIHRVAASNTFGYAFFRSRHLRVWMGPQIELACLFNKSSYTSYNIFPLPLSPGNMPIQINRYTTDFAIFSIGFGAVLGINIYYEGPFSIGFEIGFNACLGIGSHKDSNNQFIIAPGVFIPSINPSLSRTSSFGRVDGFTRICFIYRVGEIFVSETPRDVDIKLQEKI
ncbi:MAG: hypothetical protein QUS13_00635 [Smithella sp.]|nr:hypothetical protein [Smithella sp.]